MELSYEATLEDVSAPQVRHFLRNKKSSKQRISGTLWAALISPAAAYALLRLLSDEPSIVPIVLGAIAGPVAVWFTHADTTKKRICKHIERELGSRLPATTKYTVTTDTLRCESLDVDITFKLKDLQCVSEDEKRMELSFGDIGLCTIPLRAFQNEAQKSQFLSAINGENKRMESNG